jgi:enoyl-CoA hydratase/carnithine racemase
LAWGLVQACHAPGELDARANETVRAIAANAPLSLRAAKRAIRVEAEGGDADGRAEVDRLVAACFASADYAEGRRAFAEKRAPRFAGD